MILSVLVDRSSDPTQPLILCVVGFVAGIGLFFYGFRLLQRRRLILDTPFSKIRSASMGMVEVSGLAVGPYTMIAPITAHPCYYYRTVAWEYRQRGKEKEWVKVAGECMHVPFFVDDNTGRVLVDPRGAELDLHRDFSQEFNSSFFSMGNDAPPNVISFLARHGVSTSNKIKVEEFCIKPKNSLFILGTLAENPGIEVTSQPIPDAEPISSFSPQGFSLSINAGSFSLRDSAGNFETGSSDYQGPMQRDPQSHPVIRNLSASGQTVKVSDKAQREKITAALLKAGISNPAVWAAAGISPGGTPAAGVTTPGVQVIADPGTGALSVPGIASGAGATSAAAAAPAFDPRPPVILMKGRNNKTFLISWRSQREVATSLGWKCTLMIWGGPALALLSLYFFLGIRNLL
jgi:hypothetical protein